MAVKAKLWVLPSFHPRRPKTPISLVISWSALMPKPYFRVPGWRVSVMSGVV